MISFIGNSKKDKLKVIESRSALDWDWSEEHELTLRERRKVFWGPGDVLYFDHGYVYMNGFICQNSSNCIVNMGEFYWM